MKHTLAFLLLAAAPLTAQVPQAQPVDPALQADPGNDMFQRGKNLYDQAQATGSQEAKIEMLQRAAAIFSDYLTQFPNHANTEPAWLYMGQSLYLSGKVDEGKRAFQTLINRFNKGPWVGAAAYTLAIDAFNKRDYQTSAPLFQKYGDNANRPEDSARGYYYAAESFRGQNQDRQAGDLYRKVINATAGGVHVPLAKLGLGNLLLKGNKHEEALPLFEAVVTSEATPQARGEAALKAALAAAKLKKPELADKYLKLIAITPGMEKFRPDALSLLMETAMADKDYPGVLDAYRKSGLEAADAIEAPPDQKASYDEKKAMRLLLAGRANFQLKKTSEALRLFRQVESSISPQSELAYQAAYYRILCFYAIDGEHLPDQVDAFVQIYRKSRGNDKNLHTALLMKAETLFNRSDYTKAASTYAEIDASLINDSNRPGLLFNRGWCLAEAGDPQGAVKSLTKFISDYPKDSRINKAMAKRASSYVQAGEGAKAIDDFDKLANSGDEEYARLAWAESARMRRDENNLPDMIVRYKGLLAKGGTLTSKLDAEANFYIGWGLVKTNAAKDSIPYLEKARSLQPETFGKHAGLLLALGYFASQNLDKLTEEIDLAIEKQYAKELPDQALEWAGMQAYYANKFAASARFLDRISNPDEPRETSKGIWRYLGKARYETGKYEDALKATLNVLAVEEDPALKADALLDKGRELFALKRDAEAQATHDEATKMHVEGRTGAGLRMLSGDLKMRAGKAEEATHDYQYVVLWVEDRDLKPLALWKLARALEKKGDTAEAEKYSSQLKKEFPNWEAPKEG
ncbi:tetratricopeptide repeat protein [Luteolibacter ambystomatis]|uniref:Tetratricopeptide repeat protein n=1 Tax=Luteolibacter ambystomatis TaxID=2824561 RepID=A0A975PGN7_9BACT|nr:tetratricopeptide repeat protein [Luteolibacter ambystomatis]QUE52914.1 tetratricopeptide repeat protein [Luteolibacter ambystomatis]